MWLFNWSKNDYDKIIGYFDSIWWFDNFNHRLFSCLPLWDRISILKLEISKRPTLVTIDKLLLALWKNWNETDLKEFHEQYKYLNESRLDYNLYSWYLVWWPTFVMTCEKGLELLNSDRWTSNEEWDEEQFDLIESYLNTRI